MFFLLKYITLELNDESMKNILFVILVSFTLVFAAFADPGGSGSGGSSGGSGGSSGGSDGTGYRGSTGFDAELKKIVHEIEKKQNYEFALKELEVYVYENPENAHGWNFIGFTSRKLSRYEEAEVYYKTGLEIDPNHEGILAYQGELFLETERYEKALMNYAQLSDLCNFNCTEKKELGDAIAQYEIDNNL